MTTIVLNHKQLTRRRGYIARAVRIIKRSLMYGLLTALLALVFLAAVLIFTLVLGGDQTTLALVLGALLVGALFQPMRGFLRRGVDRLTHDPAPTSDTPALTLLHDNPLAQMQFGAYTIFEPLGEGGMAQVYKGRHTILNRLAAVKVLPPDSAETENFRARFELEAQTVAALRHPNIVQMFDFGSVSGVYYMAMEFISGHDLGIYIATHAPIPLTETLPILRDVASALHYAHQQGVIHRDVKPSNVMLQPVLKNGVETGFRAVLMDFGIAKVLDHGQDLTRTGTVGTLDYIAPEQILDASQVDHRADIYALALIAYQMLTGQKPYDAPTIAEKVYATLKNSPVNPCQFVPTLPDPVVKALLRGLAKNPEERYATAGEFVDALETPGENRMK